MINQNNNESCGILTAREREIVEKTKDELEHGRTILEKIPKSAEVVSAYGNILRELRGFDSELFIVSTMGMLKAGKSSLVNLLSRSKSASPTGYGSDTTLRPALVMQSRAEKPDGEIEVWFANSFADADDGDAESAARARRELLVSVFDYLRGVAPEPSEARRTSHPLTSEKLEAVLCKKHGGQGNELPSEPIIVIVRVPRAQDSLLSEKIVVLDTPGLDSMNSEWTNSGWYHWLMAESDLLLFLQSSVAPLNQSAGTVLRQIKEANRRIPIWLIQNRMEAKHWQPEEMQKDENERQRDNAAKNFKSFNLEPINYTVNLGKATTAIFEAEKIDSEKKIDAETLRKDSGFDELEGDIKKSLQEHAARLRRGNCANKVLAEYENAEFRLEKFLREKVEDALAGLAGRENEIHAAFNALESLIEPTTTPDGLRWMRIRAEDVRFDDRAFMFSGDDYQNAVDRAFRDDGIKVEVLNEFKNQQLADAQKRVRDVRRSLLPEKIFWSDGENGAKQRLNSKISSAFRNFVEGIKGANGGAWVTLKAGLVERGVVGDRLELDGEAGKCSFRDYDSAGKKWCFFEKTRSAKEAKDVVRSGKVENKTLEDALKGYFDREVQKAREGVAAWANKELENLARDFLKKLEARRDDELRKVVADREEAERQGARLKRVLDVLRCTKEIFADEMGVGKDAR